MKALVALCGAVALCGCGPKVIRLPTPVPCVNRADLPPETPAPQLTGNAAADAALLAIATLTQRKEVIQLRAVVEPCVR